MSPPKQVTWSVLEPSSWWTLFFFSFEEEEEGEEMKVTGKVRETRAQTWFLSWVLLFLEL